MTIFHRLPARSPRSSAERIQQSADRGRDRQHHFQVTFAGGRMKKLEFLFADGPLHRGGDVFENGRML